MKKVFILTSLFLLSIGLQALEEDQTSCERPVPIQHLKSMTYNSPARIEPTGSWDVAVSASYIYWYAGQDLMDLARNIPNLPLGAGLGFPVINGGTIFYHFHYHSGFKVSIGSNLPRDNWVWQLEYTRLNFTNLSNASSTGYLINHWMVAGNRVQTIAMNARWYLNFNTFDLNLSRPFYSGEYLVLSPHYGMRGGVINQSFWQISRITDAAAAVPAAIHPVSYHRSDTWFIGPRIGMLSDWMLGYGLIFKGKVAGALCYQDFDAKLNEDSIRVPGTLAVENYTNKFSQIVPNVDLGVGLSWGSYFNSKRWHFLLSALYEFNIFWNQNVMRDLKDEYTNQDSGIGKLYLHGLTTKAQFDF